MTKDLAANFDAVKKSIAEAARKARRSLAEITLIAVSKTHPIEVLRQAQAVGVRVFGENKVVEAAAKIDALGRANLEWHLIGHLQSNKARRAAKIFDVIHTIDSIELAGRLERICEEEEIEKIAVFAQIDLAGEAAKSGAAEKDLPQLAETLYACRRLKFAGLMTLPPYFEDAEKTRPYFSKLRALRDLYVPNGGLSMGMSHDFAVAIEEGATHVRVGTAIFGARDYQKNL